MDCFAKACAPSSRNVDFVIEIVVGCGADVLPAQKAVAGEGAFALSLWFVDDGFSSKRRQGVELKSKILKTWW